MHTHVKQLLSCVSPVCGEDIWEGLSRGVDQQERKVMDTPDQCFRVCTGRRQVRIGRKELLQFSKIGRFWISPRLIFAHLFERGFL